MTHGSDEALQGRTYKDREGREAGISWLRLRGQWSAWVRDARGCYEHEIFDTREEAVEALRRAGSWEGLPDA